MTKISDLIGKPLISLVDARNVGYVSNVRFDPKITRAIAAEITDDEADEPEYVYLRFSAIECGGDAATVKSINKSTLARNPSVSVTGPVNRMSFNQSGKFLGYVRDVVLENNLVTQIVCDKGTFSPKDLVSMGDDLCIFNDTGAPLKAAKPRSGAPRPARKQNAARKAAEPQSAVQTPRSPQSVTVTRTPGDPVKDYSFLLGKPVRSPVTCGGKVLIPAGTVVDESTVETARRAGKLVQLAIRAY